MAKYFLTFIFIYILSLNCFVFAQENELKNSKQSLLEKYQNFIKPEFEDISKRNLFTKQYKIAENRYLAVINTNFVNYYDKNGTLKEISNNIIRNNDYASEGFIYRNESNSTLIYFNKDASKCLMVDNTGKKIFVYNLIDVLKGGELSIESNKINVNGNGFNFSWELNGQEIYLKISKSEKFIPNFNQRPYRIDWLVGSQSKSQNSFKPNINTKLNDAIYTTSNLEIFTEDLIQLGPETINDTTTAKGSFISSINLKIFGDYYSSTYGYIRKTSSGSYSRTNSSMWIQNDDPSGCSYGFRSFAKFDLSSILQGSTINDAWQHWNVTNIKDGTVWGVGDHVDYDVRRIDSDPNSSGNASTIWSEAGTGTLYESDEQCNMGDESSDLNNFGGYTTADTDIQSSLSSGWFALGYMVKCDEGNTDFYAKGNSPYLVIDYTEPPKQINSVTWVASENSNTEISSADFGDRVWIRIEASGYGGETISGTIYENDLGTNNPFVKNISWTMPTNSNYSWTSWTIDHYEWEGGLYPRPEYFVRASKDGKTKDSKDLDVFDKIPPPKVNLSSPSNGDSFEYGKEIEFMWNSATDEGSGVDKYEIQFDDNTSINVGNNTSYKKSNLSEGNHTWKVRAEDKAGNYGSWSTSRTVSVYKKEIVDVKFVKSDGSNSQIDEANYGETIYLRVEAKGVNGKTVSYVSNEYGLVSHPNQCSKTKTFPSSGNVMWIPIGSDCLVYYYEGGTDPDPEYVVEVTIDGMNKESNHLSLRDKTPPPDVNILSPDGDEIKSYTDILFTWEPVVDNESGLKWYEIRIASDKDFNNIKWQSGVDADKNSYTLANNLLTGVKLFDGQYFFQIKAVDNSGNGDWPINYKSFSISETACAKAKIKIVGVTQLAHNNNVAPGIKIVAEIKKLVSTDIGNVILYFGDLDNSFFPLNFPKEMINLGNDYYQFVIDKNIQIGSYGLFDFKSGDRIEWNIVVNFADNDYCSSGKDTTKVFSYTELTSKINIGNGINGFVKPSITTTNTLTIGNNKFFYLNVSTNKPQQLSFTGSSLIEVPFFNSYVLNSKSLPFSFFSLPQMQVNGLQNITDGGSSKIFFSGKSLDALVFTAADMVCNLITLFTSKSNLTSAEKALLKTKAIYSYAKVISKIIKDKQLEGELSTKTEVELIWELIKTARDNLTIDTYKNFLANDLTAFGFSNASDQIDEVIKIVPIINQTLAGLNFIGTIGDLYLASKNDKFTDSISISRGNGHFVNAEQLELPGVANTVLKQSDGVFKLRLTNESQLKLYNIWLGFDIFAFDRNTNQYIKVENTKTPIEDPISLGGTGKIGKINFSQQSYDLEPGQSVDFISDPYTFSQSVSGHNYRADNIPYKYVFSVWSSGYPGQTNPTEAVRLSYENVSVPFYVADNINPQTPTIAIDQSVSNESYTFFTWNISTQDTMDVDKVQIYVDNVLWKEIDARNYKSAVCVNANVTQEVKIRITDIGNNSSSFSNTIIIPVKSTPQTRIVLNKSSIIFGDQQINTNSNSQSYTVFGSNLTSNIEINSPTGFELSLNNSSWQTTITLNQSNGTVSETTIYVRFKPTLVQPYSGNIQHTSFGATPKDLSVNGTGTSSCGPNWTPVTYTNSTTAYGIVTIEGQPAESDDLVGVFVGSECRAVGNINIDQGKAYVTLIIQGNNVETINFKIYDKSKCTELNVLYSTQTNPGNSIGVPPNYLPIASSSSITQSLSFITGWNLVSLNVQPSDMSTAAVFAPIISSLKEVKNLSKTFSPDVSSFLNTLTNLVNSSGYWVKVSSDVTLNITGTPVDYQNESISLLKGWNLVGYTCQSNNEIKSALSSIWNVLEEAKDLSSSYNTSVPEFLNTLVNLVSGSGYWMKVSSDASLTYPQPTSSNYILSKGNESATNNKIAYKNWKPIIYPNSMVFYCQINVNNLPIKSGAIGAFVNGECRGYGKIITHNEVSYSTLVINGVKEDKVNFKIFDSVSNEVISTDGKVTLIPGSTHPEILELDGYTKEYLNNLLPKTTFLYPSYPNPFNPTTQIKFDIQKTTNVSLSIYNINGQLVNKIISNKIFEPGTYNFTWNGKNSNNDKISSGIYLIQFITKEKNQVSKVILLK